MNKVNFISMTMRQRGGVSVTSVKHSTVLTLADEKKRVACECVIRVTGVAVTASAPVGGVGVGRLKHMMM